MTIFLFSLLTAGAERMAATDPHGWTLTLISVSIVFSALVILFALYSLSGGIFSGKFKRSVKHSKSDNDAEVVAAIAMALEAQTGNAATEVAIATALHLFLSDAAHDIETGIITIHRKESAWNNKQLTLRKSSR